MKNPFDVLRIKEQELLKVKREVEALRIAARLLGGNGSVEPPEGKTNSRQRVEMP